MAQSIRVEGFVELGINGVYTETKIHDGHPFFEKDDSFPYVIMYRDIYSPYAFNGGYYITKVSQIGNSVPIFTPIYKYEGTMVTQSEWIALSASVSTTTFVDSAEIDIMSSSSSSDSSSSDSSSSSNSSISEQSSESSASEVTPKGIGTAIIETDLIVA